MGYGIPETGPASESTPPARRAIERSGTTLIGFLSGFIFCGCFFPVEAVHGNCESDGCNRRAENHSCAWCHAQAFQTMTDCLAPPVLCGAAGIGEGIHEKSCQESACGCANSHDHHVHQELCKPPCAWRSGPANAIMLKVHSSQNARDCVRNQQVHVRAGTCWVMQWRVPSPSTRSRQQIPTTLRVGNRLLMVFRARRSFGSLKTGTRTTLFAM